MLAQHNQFLDQLTELEDVVHLNVVSLSRKNFARTFGSISVVVSVLKVRSVLHLFLSGEREELLTNGKLTINFILGQTEVGDIKEADLVMLESVGEYGRRMIFSR